MFSLKKLWQFDRHCILTDMRSWPTYVVMYCTIYLHLYLKTLSILRSTVTIPFVLARTRYFPILRLHLEGCNPRTLSEIEIHDKNKTIPWDVSRRTVYQIWPLDQILMLPGQVKLGKRAFLAGSVFSWITFELRKRFLAPSCYYP